VASAATPISGVQLNPLAKRVHAGGSIVTRFYGAFLKGQARAFGAPDGAASVSGRPTTTFRAVLMADGDLKGEITIALGRESNFGLCVWKRRETFQ
jgi:hypothetical protein